MFYNLKKRDLDKYIYRIISLEWLFELFTTRRNILAKPAEWEDTFENFILKSKVRHLSGEIIEYNIHDRIYGQCWTLERASDAMWRIYSPNKNRVRIRTTAGALLDSLYEAHPSNPEAKCALGRVQYVNEGRLMKIANNTFDDSGILVENIFRSLLFKRKAFKHENEIRLLYDGWAENNTENKLYAYNIDPHKLISQIMIDPRVTYSDFKSLKLEIVKETEYQGSVLRSLLYRLPDDVVVNVTNDMKDK